MLIGDTGCKAEACDLEKGPVHAGGVIYSLSQSLFYYRLGIHVLQMCFGYFLEFFLLALRLE